MAALRCNVMACETECERLGVIVTQDKSRVAPTTIVSVRRSSPEAMSAMLPPVGQGQHYVAPLSVQLVRSVDRSVDCSVRLFIYLPRLRALHFEIPTPGPVIMCIK